MPALLFKKSSLIIKAVTLCEASRTQNEFYIERTQNEFYIEFHAIKLTIAWEEQKY